MADSQVPWGVEGPLDGEDHRSGVAKDKPTWYLVVTDDRMIPLPAQRFMSKRAGATDNRGLLVVTPFTCPTPRAVATLIETGGTIPAPREFRGVKSSRVAGRTLNVLPAAATRERP